MGLRLGTPLGQPHECRHCRTEVDAFDTHGLNHQSSDGRQPRHAAVIDIIHRSLTIANIPFKRKRSGLYRSDGKQFDSCSILPWRCGHFLIWETTYPNTYASLHLSCCKRSRHHGCSGRAPEPQLQLRVSPAVNLCCSIQRGKVVTILGTMGRKLDS